jgi:hypothetical protein
MRKFDWSKSKQGSICIMEDHPQAEGYDVIQARL